jgi:uncharacterized membrane protein
MSFLGNMLGWILRGIAFMMGRERVVRWLIRAAEKDGHREIADIIRSEYFKMFGEVIR